jgi:hypothetical protein
MRLIGLTLALTFLSLANAPSSLAAPAPLPRRDREAPSARQRRLLDECRRRLDELKVAWWVVENRDGRQAVYFRVDPASGPMRGDFPIDGDLSGALRQVIKQVESYFKYGRL